MIKSLLLIIITCTSAIPQQQPLVCKDIYQTLFGQNQGISNYNRRYCDRLFKVVCWQNQTDDPRISGPPGYPPYLVQNPEGLFTGVGVSFDIYKNWGSNSTYYRWPWDSGQDSLFVNSSNLLSRNGIVVTSYFESVLEGDSSFYIAKYQLVLQYPWFSVMNASGVDCSHSFPIQSETPPPAVNLPSTTSSVNNPPDFSVETPPPVINVPLTTPSINPPYQHPNYIIVLTVLSAVVLFLYFQFWGRPRPHKLSSEPLYLYHQPSWVIY